MNAVASVLAGGGLLTRRELSAESVAAGKTADRTTGRLGIVGILFRYFWQRIRACRLSHSQHLSETGTVVIAAEVGAAVGVAGLVAAVGNRRRGASGSW
jgi:hypothetical protein